LRIPGGRKWLVEPLGSVVVTFVFTPLLPGLFEETLFLENILEPNDKQVRAGHTTTERREGA